MKVTGCILARNEESLIESCLQNLARYADEIVLVDNGSIDQTAAIAERFGCRVLHSHRRLDECRNAYLDAARGDWVLVLDADERLDIPEEQYLKIVRESPSEVWGVRLGRYDYYGSGLWSYAQVLRLWRNHPEVRYDDMAIHNTVSTAMLRAGGKIVCVDNAMQHLDALLPARHVPKRRRYLDLSRELVEKYPWLLCYIGLEHVARGEFVDARRAYEAAIEKGNTQEDSIRYFAHLLLGNLWLSLGDLKRAKDNLSVPMSRGPAANWYHQACVAVAEVALREGEIAQAVSLCRAGLDAPPFPAQVHLNLAALAELEGDKEEADTRVEYALAVNRYLMNDEIYAPIRREHKTMYELQPSLLSIVDTERLVMEHLQRRGRAKEAWRLRARA